MTTTLKHVTAITDQIVKFLGNPVPPGTKIYLERGHILPSGVATVDQLKILES